MHGGCHDCRIARTGPVSRAVVRSRSASQAEAMSNLVCFADGLDDVHERAPDD